MKPGDIKSVQMMLLIDEVSIIRSHLAHTEDELKTHFKPGQNFFVVQNSAHQPTLILELGFSMMYLMEP